MSVDDLAQKFGGLNTETITYLKSAKRGEASLEGLSASMTSASVGAKLLSVALNALSGLAISLIIKGFTWVLDELIVTLDEQKQKLDEAVTAYEESKSELEQINDELKTTGERIDELNGKENLTFTEQDELEKLIKTNDELERKIYLLEQANKEAEKEVATEAQNTYDKYTNDRTIGAVEQIDFYADSSLLEGVSWDNFKGDLSWLVAQYKNQQEILTNAQANGWAQIEEQTKSNLELLEGYMSDASLDYQDLYDKISGISDYAMTDELKVAKQDLDDILDIVAELLGYGGQRSETSFDNIWNSEDFSQYKTELETLAKEGKLDATVLESNENYKKLLEDTGTTAEDTAQHINALVDEMKKTGQEANKIDVSNIFELKDTEDNFTTLGKLSESIDNIQNAYKTLYSAIEEYNSEGAISVDTLQSVIALGDDWLDYLVDEQGNLKLDQEALQNLTASRLNDMRVQAINNVIDNVSKINDEVSAKEYLASTNYALAESYEELAEKKLEDLQLSLTLKGLDTGTIDSVMGKASADISKINKLFDNTNISSSSIIGGSGSSKSEKEWKDYLDKLLSSYEAELELGLIDFENFTDKSFDLVEKFYREGKITAEEYWDSINKLYEKQLGVYDKALKAVTRRIDKEIEGIEKTIECLEKQNDELEEQKDNYDKVISAVTRRIDKEIEGIEDVVESLEEQNDKLEEQKDNYDKILSVVENVYDDAIKNLEDEKTLLQDKIDALEDEADAYDLVRKKEEALYALEQAQRNRSKKIYVEGKGYIYDQDREAIRTAQDDLHNIKNEEVVKSLQKEQEAIDESIKVLEEYKQKWVEISNVYETEQNRQLTVAVLGKNYEQTILQNRVSDINNFKNQYVDIQKQINDNQPLINSYNEKIQYYANLKQQWNDIADVYEQSIEDQHTSMILGLGWERDILNGRSQTLNNFKDKYVSIQKQIDDNTGLINSYNEKIQYYENLKKQWTDIADVYEQSVEDQCAAMILGKNWEKDILDERSKKLNSFKTEYVGIQEAMAKSASESAKAQAEAANKSSEALKKVTNNKKAIEQASSDISAVKVQRYRVVKKEDNRTVSDGYTNVAEAFKYMAELEKYSLLKGKFKVEAYSKGGVVGGGKKNPLDVIAQQVGEDRIIAVKDGERVLTPVQNEIWEKALPNLQEFTKTINFTPNIKMPDYSHLSSMMIHRDTTPSISIGEIHLHEVNNVDSFANAIIKEFPNKIQQAYHRR